MKATRFEFRLRVAIISALYFLGFWAPWERLGAAGNPNPMRLWSWLAIEASRTGLISVAAAYLAVTIAAVALALMGAGFRVWGTSYLGHFVMRNKAMQAGAVMASGPYRHLRNPLYLGMLLTSFAIAVLMPASGALFFVLAMLLLTLRLIGGEEAFLAGQLGEAYSDYRKSVPSLLPSLRPRMVGVDGAPTSGCRAWCRNAFRSPLPSAFVALAWRYDASLLTRCVLICFGASLVVHGLISTQAARAADVF